ncbi:MAG: TonB-dependent receptor [Bacteroidales bacterium]|nr:TonB-dependent receptor [Bacteroidales bacterium]
MSDRIIITILAFCLSLLGFTANGAPKGHQVEGCVIEAESKAPVIGAAVRIGTDYLWTTTDIDGRFRFENVQSGEYELEVSCLGYVNYIATIDIRADISGITVTLHENSLALDEVVVTAQKAKDGLGTSHSLGRDALNHLQLSNMTDVAALLPGGKTVNPDLTTENQFSLREGGSNLGNSAFGTAVEVDGVRIGNNASFGDMKGVDTRSVAVENIESIEVITGVPSAEYGDLNSGVVKINTRKGRTPTNITFSVNPRTYQASVSKGVDLQKNNGILNLSAEWARAVKRLISPYESYTRTGITLGYSNTFAKVLRFEAGFTGNIGGMNSKDDPDAFTGEFEKERDNVFRGNTSLTWLLNKSWITNLKFDASVNFNDNLYHFHKYESYASNQPSVHAENEGYFLADRLPLTYFSDQVIDSKELDFAASLKYNWHKRWNDMKSSLKAGVQWKANGNVGEGEYYQDPSLAANGYRPRPYSQYPFMHNLSAYAEEHLTFPVGKTKVEITAGLRMENVFIKNSLYNNKTTFSPRFNARWEITEGFAIRGGWGVTEKLPSYHILYPKQEYRDIQTYGFSHGDQTSYIYYTQPYTVTYNPELRWQRNNNSEFGIDAAFCGMKISLVGFYNVTKGPYNFLNVYEPYSYNILKRPDGFVMPADPEIVVDSQTGMMYVRGSEEEYWTPMDIKVTDRTFAKSTKQNNGADVKRAGAEIVMEFPEITPIRTSFRLDASYTHTRYLNEQLSAYYQNGWSHTSLPDRSYQYVGIYANGGATNHVANGKVTHNLDANLTAITHIPQARLIITCRLEMSLLRRSRNLSVYNGEAYAFTVTETGKTPTGGNINDGNSYTAIYPVSYMDLDGNIHPFTQAEAADPAFTNLILKSTNAYTFAQDGYGPYMSANISVTKEIGDHISLSFFANNFTNSRPYVKSMATGVGAIFTPAFYYGLTCRLKF